MKFSVRTRLFLMTSLLGLSVLAPGAAQPPAEETSAEAPDDALVGRVTREQIEAAHPAWVQATVAAAPEVEAAKALATVEPGAEVTVFLGTWCGDSEREVPRFWRALDEAGGSVPFSIIYIGVDRKKQQPSAPILNYEIEFVPTFIVSRGGREVGRIIEQPPHGLEQDLLALLTGKAQGNLSASQTGETAPPSR